MRKSNNRKNGNDWAAWYDLAIWSDLRRATFARDALTCTSCGLVCVGRAPAPHSPVCDHVNPHRGNWVLFTDPDNLQTLCKACHDGDKQGIEARGYSLRLGPDGWPCDAAHPANRKA